MKLSESANKLRIMIEKAIDDHVITRHEYDQILNLATQDGHIDAQEQSLLDLLQGMIEDGSVKMKA